MDLLTYLKQNPEARERKNKNKVVSKFIWDRHHRLEETEEGGFEYIAQHNFSDIVADILTLDRNWRLILKNNKDLRGKDYNEKFHLEVEKQRELGYNVK